MGTVPKARTFFVALALCCLLQSVEVSGHLNPPQPQPQPQVIPQYIPVPQYQQPPQYIPVPQYVQQPQYIPVPQYVPQPQMMYHPPPHVSYHHHRPHFDCYRGIKMDELISDADRMRNEDGLQSGSLQQHQ